MPRSFRRRLGAVLIAVAALAAHTTVDSSAAGADSGYWLVDARGNIYEFGGALFKGSASSSAPIVAMASTQTGQGYTLAAADGGVFTFGDAPFKGSLGGQSLNRPIVGMAATPSGQGYWLVAADGGVFTFGDAPFKGSLGGQSLNRPIVGMAATPSGQGYWLVAADGGIFTFGDAPFKGSMGGQSLNRPVVGMAATPSGQGYWLVASDGGVFAFDAPFFGSAGASMIDAPIVGLTIVPDGSGYWMADATGDVYNFAGAKFSGEADDCPLPAGIVAIAASGIGTASSPAPPRPNCGLPLTTSSTTTTTTASGGGSAFQIGLVGDTGYTSSQESDFRDVRAHANTLPLAFVTHDGDIKSGSSSCSDSKFRSVRDVFNGFAAPVVYTPGDNEWQDCAEGSSNRLSELREVFFSTSQSLGKNKITLTRQPTYVENARWTKGGVVFVTVNEPGSTGGSGSLRDAGEAWLNQAFDLAKSTNAPGIMVIWQDNPFSPSGGRLYRTLQDRTEDFGKPVVLVHGDTHAFKIDHPWSDLDNFTRVETYAGGDSDRWVLATVDPKSSSVFSFRSMRAP